MQPRFQANVPSIKPRLQANIPSNQCYTARIFQICSAPVGYDELAGGFEPIGNGEIF